MKRSMLLFAALAASLSLQAMVPTVSQADKDRAAALVKQMTFEEKCGFVIGYKDFFTMPIERLGIPAVHMSDGPQGVHVVGENPTQSTYYPCGIALAAGWNKETVHKVGTGIGTDAKARGVGIMLCPGVNIYRSPLCGRNFEYMGEDPYLAGETASAFITGIQEQGIMSTIKHFAVNNQEYARHWVNSNIDERTMHEIYFPVFRKAVQQAKVGAVMTSYNPINGCHASENPYITKTVLREKWGFDGLVVSDWTSTYSPVGCLLSGLDLEMPKGYALRQENIKALIDNGIASMDDLDIKRIHILQTLSAFGFLDKGVKDENIPLDNEPSHKIAYTAAVEAPVLLKNKDNALPLKAGSIALVGPNADYIPFGGGSGEMNPFPHRTTTLYQGLCSEKGFKVTLRQKMPNAAELKKIQTIVLAVGFDKNTERENYDRTYSLPRGQNELINEAVATGKKVIVVVYSGGEVDVTKWIDKVDAVIMAWYTGQASGQALADIISGKISPSGRLPFTFWGSMKNNPTTPHYPILKLKRDVLVPWAVARYDKNEFTDYTEGIFVGYRGAEKFGKTPLFPFGYGLTYSSFEYSNISVQNLGTKGVTVTFTLKNTGTREAAEVAQVYVAPKNPSVMRPARELKGYEKVKLAKGESKTVTVTLPLDAFSYYDIKAHDWTVDACDYAIEVGPSAGNAALVADVTIEK